MVFGGRIGQPTVMNDDVRRNCDKIYGEENWLYDEGHVEVAGALPFNPLYDLFFVTSNSGKVESARRSLTDVTVGQIAMDIPENLDTIEDIASYKANVAYSVLCRPVICDDSGFVIPSLDGYPGVRVGRELQEHGIESFTKLATNEPLDAYFVMAVSYMDHRLDEPQIFVSKVHGKLIGEQKGDLNKPFVKSPLASCFVVDGQEKTIAEMTEQEYRRDATTDRWAALAEFLRKLP